MISASAVTGRNGRVSDKRNPDVVVVGGAAGAVIAHKLAERGKRVALLFRNDVPGATDTNQKWLHSGLLYPSYKLAATAWRNRKQDWKIKAQTQHSCHQMQSSSQAI